MSALLYRIHQLARAIGARPSPRDLSTARSFLADEQWRLFAAMSPRDQWHAVETLRLLGELGDDRDIAAAALLHDVGKGYIRLHERVVYVLAARVPRLLCKLQAPHGPRWRTALYRTARHAEAGAGMAAAAGAPARTAQLIRGHHAPAPGDPQATALAIADDRA